MNDIVRSSKQLGFRRFRVADRARLFTCCFALAVTACGGGGSSGTGTGTGAGTGTGSGPIQTGGGTTSSATPPEFVLADASLTTLTKNGETTYQTTGFVFNQTRDGVDQTVDFGVAAGILNFPGWRLSSFTVDRAARKRTYNGDSAFIYVKDGKIWKVDLAKTASRTPVQVSSISNACRLSWPWPLSADGSLAWFTVSVANGSQCNLSDEILQRTDRTNGVYIRTDMSPGTPAISLNGRSSIQAVLDDGALNALGLLVRVDSKLYFFDKQMGRQGEVTGAASTSALTSLAYDYSSLQAMYFRAGNALQRLTWTDTAAAFEAPKYTFVSTSSAALSQADSTFFHDGTKFMKVVGPGTPTTIGFFPDLPIFLRGGTNFFVAQHSGSTTYPLGSFSVIDKSTGSVRTVGNMFSVGTSGDIHVYSGLGGTNESTYVTSLDGRRSLTVPLSLSPVHSRIQEAGNDQIEGFIACAGSTASPCSNSRIVQIDLAGTQIDLGTLSHATQSGNFNPGPTSIENQEAMRGPYSGLPSLAALRAQLPTDANGVRAYATEFYSFIPGTPLSLTRMTTAIP